MDMREIWRLHQFLAVVEATTLHGAAKSLNVSQPALTKSIRQLETAFGCDLFMRLPRGVRLTEAGEVLYHRAREIETAWNAAIVEVGAQSTGLNGVMRIGGGPTYSSIHFPELLVDLRRAFPHMRVQVSTGVGNELLPLVKSGDILAYAGGVPGESDDFGAGFETEVLYQQDSAVYAAADHPLFANGNPRAEDTLDYPWLCLFSGQQANSRIERFFERAGLPPPRVALESHSLQIAFKMLAEHRFVGCMPVPLAVGSRGLSLREIELPDFRWAIPTGVTYHRASLKFAPLRLMLRSLRRLTGWEGRQHGDTGIATFQGQDP